MHGLSVSDVLERMTVLAHPTDPATSIRRASSAIAADVQGEVVILDTVRGSYLNLDAIGSDIWQQLEAPVTVAALVAGLADRYDAPPEQIANDISEWLSELAVRNLILID